MRILSLFDGISCARVALERAGVSITDYYASEVDKYAIQITQKNYSDTKQVGDITLLKGRDFADIDLIIGGSPCQDLSIAKKDRQGLKGQRSGLFYEYVRILNEVKPKYFILENVNSMPKEAKEQISEILGVEPVMINAALVSAQNRKRLFWVGKLINAKYQQVEILQPTDRGILLKDILQPPAEVDERMVVKGKSFSLTASYNGAVAWNSIAKKQRTMVKIPAETKKIGNIYPSGGQSGNVYYTNGKSSTLMALGGGAGAKTELYLQDKQIRKLTPIECERLQGLPDDYTSDISNTQRYKALGNAFNVDVVAHIISNLLKD